MSFREIFEGSVAGDVAGYSGKMGLHKQHKHGAEDGECPCKKDPESKECKEKRALKEARETQIAKMISEISKCKDFKLIDIKNEINGYTALIRYKDNAYEMNIIPAMYSKKFPDKTKKD